jgi:hypothetical protein
MQYELRVDRFDLLEGLKRIAPRNSTEARRYQKLFDNKRGKPKADLAFDGKFLSIEALDNVIVAKAEGVWAGFATVNASLVVALASAPPAGEPVVLACDGEHLRFGPLTVGCTWQSVAHTLLDLPATPDWIEALSFKYRTTRARIIKGGFQSQIQEAEHNLDKLIRRVAKSLAPLGVSDQDIRTLVESRLAERFTRAN